MELPPELYEQVAETIRQDGEFRFQYRTYLRHLKAAALETGQPYNGFFPWSALEFCTEGRCGRAEGRSEL